MSKRSTTFLFIGSALMIAPGLVYLYITTIFGVLPGNNQLGASLLLATLGAFILLVTIISRSGEL